MLDFAMTFDLLVANSFFKKKEDHLVTFKSSSCKTQIDYFLTRKESRRSCKDCKEDWIQSGQESSQEGGGYSKESGF